MPRDIPQLEVAEPCYHIYERIHTRSEADQYPTRIGGAVIRGRKGVVIGCQDCGHIKTLWNDGTIEIGPIERTEPTQRGADTRWNGPMTIGVNELPPNNFVGGVQVHHWDGGANPPTGLGNGALTAGQRADQRASGIASLNDEPTPNHVREVNL